MPTVTATSSIDAVLCDLDGTLVDTAPCIAAALNLALADNGLGGIDARIVLTLIGGGVPTLVERALRKLGIEGDRNQFDAVLARYRALYLQSAAPPLLPFPGVEPALAELKTMGLKLAVVTNTFDRFAHTILDRCNLAHSIDVVVSADTLPERKPHPAPLRHACRALGVLPAHALFVGDSSNDAQAAAAAEMRMVVMSYGYNEGKPVQALPCMAILDDFGELPAWVRATRTIAAG